MQKRLHRLLDEEDGQGQAEYALILGLVALASIGFLSMVTKNSNGFFDIIIKALDL